MKPLSKSVWLKLGRRRVANIRQSKNISQLRFITGFKKYPKKITEPLSIEYYALEKKV